MCLCKTHRNSSGPTVPTHRLPGNVVPIHYDLLFHPNPTGKSGRFKGSETITLMVLESTKTIVLNVDKISISSAIIRRGKQKLVGKVTVDKKAQVATIKFSRKLERSQQWELSLSFTGTHNHQLRGWYKSKWKKDGVDQVIVTTQHEAAEARKTFPCFDEPALKATFKVRMVIGLHLTALSNGRCISEQPLGHGKKLVEFAPTPKMSTYLTCFIVGDLVSSPVAYANGKEIRIWCVPGKEHMTSWALKCAVRGIEWYEWYFGIPYFGGGKIDHVAIPDFEAGAMENTGCVTYRESALLCDEATASNGEKEGIAVTVLHETAHFWFGDLVTMFWWNGLWLNESFATFMQNVNLALWMPEYKVWDSFGQARAAALGTDALKSTHPIEVVVNHPDEVNEIFDVISYNKGGSVLDMIHQFIGFEVFRQGIQIYLKRHALGNTQTGDLWDALEEACSLNDVNVPVRRIMDTWVFTPGHPVVSVDEGEKPGTIKLSQQQFRYLNDEVTTALWPIPIIIRARGLDGSVIEKKIVLDAQSAVIDIGYGYRWVKINAGGSGVYRTRYSSVLAFKLTGTPQPYASLSERFNLSVIERYNFVNDAWACVKAGLTDSVDFLQLVPMFVGETDPNVMGILLGGLSALYRLLPEDRQIPLRSFIRRFVRPTFDLLGWTRTSLTESIQLTDLRRMLFLTLGIIGQDASVRGKAEEMFESWLKDKKSIDPNMLGAVAEVLAYWGDEKRYEQFDQLWKKAQSPRERNIFLYHLRSFRDPALLRKTLELSFSGEISVQDSPGLFAGLIGNKYSQEFAWQYMRSNWEQVRTTFPVNMVPRIVSTCASLDTPERAKEVREFFAAHEVKAGSMALGRMLEQLDIGVRLRQAESERLAAFDIDVLADQLPAFVKKPV